MLKLRWKFNDRFIENFLENVLVTEFLKLVNAW